MTVRADTQLVEIGMKVWALPVAELLDVDVNAVKGGTVVAIETDVDPDTAEVQRRFITAAVWRGGVRFDSLVADDVAQVEPMNVAGIRTLIRAAAKVVANSKRVFTTDEARCIDLQRNLMEAMG